MLGLNSTGRENPVFYHLPRACVYVGLLDANGAVVRNEYFPIGHVAGFTISADIATTEHRNLCDQNGAVDDLFDTNRRFNVSFQAEELHHANTARFFFGSIDAPANPAVAGLTAYLITTSAVRGATYFIANASGVRAMGIVAADLTITYDVTGTPVVLVLGTDYTVDEAQGSIHLLSTGVVVPSSPGQELGVVLVANAGAPAVIDRVQGVTVATQQYRVVLKGENGRTGKKFEVAFESVRLIPDGELPMVQADELASMGFTGAALVNSAVTGRSKVVNVSSAR